jgi:hypothetical protein
LKPSRSVSIGSRSSNSFRVSVATSILGLLNLRVVTGYKSLSVTRISWCNLPLYVIGLYVYCSFW